MLLELRTVVWLRKSGEAGASRVSANDPGFVDQLKEGCNFSFVKLDQI